MTGRESSGPGVRARRTRRHGTRALVAGLVALALFSAADARGAPVPHARKLRIALNGFENNITPFSITFAAIPNTHDLTMLVYDTLFWSQASGDPEPWLAEKAVPSADFTRWTVTLRPNLKWQDGKPLTAEDVKFTFDYYLKFAALGGSGRYVHHVSDVPPFQRAEVLNPRTVRFIYKKPAPTFKILPGADLPIIPKHVWARIKDPAKATKMLPVGSGPYRVTKIVPDQLYVLKANRGYFKGRPTVDELDLPIVQDPTAAFQSLRTGQVDFVPRNLPPELITQFSHESGIREVKATRLLSTQLYFNARKVPWSDARVRKAISLATDERAIVRRVLLGHGRPGDDGFLAPRSPWVVPGAHHEYDPARARGMLDRAGYRVGPGGVRAGPGGRRLELHVLVSSFDPLAIRATELMAAQVKGIGVKMVVEPLDPATLRDRSSALPGKTPTDDAYIGNLETHAEVDPDGLYYFFHSPGLKGFGGGISGWSDPRFDRLAEAATTKTAAQRKPLLHRMQQLLAAQAPVIVLDYPDEVYAFRSAAYNGWKPDFGQAIFTKRSFLPASVNRSAVSGGSGGSTSAWVVIGPVLAVIALGLLLFALVRRRRGRTDEEEFA